MEQGLNDSCPGCGGQPRGSGEREPSIEGHCGWCAQKAASVAVQSVQDKIRRAEVEALYGED